LGWWVSAYPEDLIHSPLRFLLAWQLSRLRRGDGSKFVVIDGLCILPLHSACSVLFALSSKVG